MALVFDQMKARLYSVLRKTDNLEKEAQEFSEECIPDDPTFVAAWTGVAADETGKAPVRALFYRLCHDVFAGEDVGAVLQRYVDIFHGCSPNQRMVNDLLGMERAEQESPARMFTKRYSAVGVLGGPPVSDDALMAYLDLHGKEYTAQALPKDVKLGVLKHCYMNATKLAMAKSDEFVYVEGIAYDPAIPGMVFCHAWVADKDGNVIDNTWKNPAECKYFGVPVSLDRLWHWADKTKVYGIFGGSDDISRKLIMSGEAP